MVALSDVGLARPFDLDQALEQPMTPRMVTVYERANAVSAVGERDQVVPRDSSNSWLSGVVLCSALVSMAQPPSIGGGPCLSAFSVFKVSLWKGKKSKSDHSGDHFHGFGSVVPFGKRDHRT